MAAYYASIDYNGSKAAANIGSGRGTFRSQRKHRRVSGSATLYVRLINAWSMTMSFRITGLPSEPFANLFTLSDDELRARGAVRRIAEGNSPCRISLTDARPGDELILVNYEHHPVDSPYRMRFAIYVRRGEEQFDAIDQIPEQLRTRTLAVRAFDANAMMVGWELVDGQQVEPAIERLLAIPSAAYLHIHFAAPGCYAARVERV